MKKILLSILFILATWSYANADCTEQFSWVQNIDNTTGYKIYYGTSNADYPNSIDIGNPSPIDGRCHGTVPELVCGTEYFFVCVAYNAEGIESGYSNQVIATPVGDAPSAPRDFRVE